MFEDDDYNPDDYVYIDCETTGLTVGEHGLLEFAYAVGNEEPRSIIPHGAYGDIRFAQPDALDVNKFLTRFAADPDNGVPVVVPEQRFAYEGSENSINGFWEHITYLKDARATVDEEHDFWNDYQKRTKGLIPVGANVHFDIAFVERHLSPEPLNTHHRILSLNAWVGGRLGAPGVISFSQALEAANEYTLGGFKGPEIDHTAAGDVKAGRYVHQIFNEVGHPVDTQRAE